MENILKAIVCGAADAAETHLGRRAEDFIGDDGLLHCGKCKMPREIVVDFPFGRLQTKVNCRCDIERIERDRIAYEQRMYAEMVAENRKQAFRQPGLAAARFGADSDKYTEAARRFVEHFPEFQKAGKGILLYGGVGVGKTYLAACIINALLDKGYTASVTDIRSISNDLFGKTEGKQAYIDDLCRKDIVLLDDLASERDTQYMNETAFTIINALYQSKVPVLVTTNLTVEQLKHPQSQAAERIYSRILEMCHPIKVEGEDRRRTRAASEYKAVNQLLGL